MVPMSSSQVAQSAATRSILEAPLHLRTLRWTSADVAMHLGVSQTFVARTWRRVFRPVGDDIGDNVRDHAGALVGVGINHDNVLLVLSRRRHSSIESAFMRHPRRAPLQALLAADLVRPTLATDTADVAARLWRRATDQGHDPNSLLVLARMHTDAVPVEHLLVVDNDARWQALLADLVAAAVETPMTSLRQLQAQLNDWAANRRPRFEWLAPSASHSAHGVPTRTAPIPRPLGEAVADEAFRAIVARITSGQLVGGDRITETSLQRSLRTSRNQVREALRTLALGGLVLLEPHRGAVVPIPKVQDVIDTYDARLALGRLLIERASTATQRDLKPADAALKAMLKLAETSDARATGDADVRFQDALISSITMPQIQAMFRALSSQVMLYTAVLGMKYVYSIPEMCRDDLRIFQAVSARDTSAALHAWECKIEAAKRFMTSHL